MRRTPDQLGSNDDNSNGSPTDDGDVAGENGVAVDPNGGDGMADYEDDDAGGNRGVMTSAESDGDALHLSKGTSISFTCAGTKRRGVVGHRPWPVSYPDWYSVRLASGGSLAVQLSSARLRSGWWSLEDKLDGTGGAQPAEAEAARLPSAAEPVGDQVAPSEAIRSLMDALERRLQQWGRTHGGYRPKDSFQW